MLDLSHTGLRDSSRKEKGFPFSFQYFLILGLLRLSTRKFGSGFGKGIFDSQVELRHLTLAPGIHFFSPSSKIFRIHVKLAVPKLFFLFFCTETVIRGLSYSSLYSVSCQLSIELHSSLLLLSLIKAFALPC